VKHPEAWKTRLYFLSGQRLRERREGAGMSVRELAEQICVTRTSIEKFESGETPITFAALYKATEVFDCTADDLMPVMTEDLAG
jgi:transcriptional regulator with XRE-family HTH domain